MKTKLKEFRARLNITQEDLANKVGVRRETILFIEKGKYNPSLKLAKKIANVFNEKIDDIFIFDKKELEAD
jgi:putative transcriptional regulator